LFPNTVPVPTSHLKLGKGYQTLVYGDLALLGDRAQGYFQWYHPNSEKTVAEIIIYSKWYAN